MPLTLSRVITASDGNEPLNLDQVKAHLRIDTADEDEYLNGLISVAREQIEETYGLALSSQTWKLQLDGFPYRHGHPHHYHHLFYPRHGMTILLPRPPLTGVVDFTYIDTDGAEQSLVEGTDFQVDTDSMPGRVAPYPGTSWPSTQAQTLNAVSILYTCGWDTVPTPIARAMLLICGDFYENREQTVLSAANKVSMDAVQRLMSGYLL